MHTIKKKKIIDWSDRKLYEPYIPQVIHSLENQHNIFLLSNHLIKNENIKNSLLPKPNNFSPINPLSINPLSNNLLANNSNINISKQLNELNQLIKTQYNQSFVDSNKLINIYSVSNIN